MFKKLLILFVVFNSFNDLYSQQEELNNDKGKDNFKNETILSIGTGYSITFGGRSDFMISIDFIPKLSDKFFLDFKLDVQKLGNQYNTILNCIPEYKVDISKVKSLTFYFGAGLAEFNYRQGFDASVMTEGKLEYGQNRFFLNAEVRKPIYFYEDTGHLDLLLNINLGFKL